MERDFTWDKPFARRCDVDDDNNVIPCELLCVADTPFSHGETHVVRVGDLIKKYYANGAYLKNGKDDEDLVNIPEKKVVERWVVIPSLGMGAVFDTSYWAEQMASDYRSLGFECRIHHIREEF